MRQKKYSKLLNEEGKVHWARPYFASSPGYLPYLSRAVCHIYQAGKLSLATFNTYHTYY